MSDPPNLRAIKALANPVRRRILELLRDGEMPVNSIAAEFDVARPAISRHLKVLREARLIRFRSDHNVRFYSLDADEMDRLRDGFDADFRDFWRPQGASKKSADPNSVSTQLWLAREVEVASELPVSCLTAYSYVTEQDQFKRWVGPDAASNPQVGGTISATSAFGGKLEAEFLALEPGKFLALRIVNPLDPSANLYTIAFEPVGKERCRIILRHFVRDEKIARLVMFAWGETWKLLRSYAEQEAEAA